MVLWEITLATAYWLGIRRTYRLALKLQRRLISPKHPRVRDFMHRRTRNVFDIALKVHKEIQSRDLSAGRSLGNFILRFLDRARPSANIRGPPPGHCCENIGQKKLSAGGSSGEGPAAKYLQEKKPFRSNTGPDKVLFSQFANRGLFVQPMSNGFNVGIGRRCPGIQATNSISGHRPCTTIGHAWEKSELSVPASWRGSLFEKGVFRSDIALWMGAKAAKKSITV